MTVCDAGKNGDRIPISLKKSRHLFQSIRHKLNQKFGKKMIMHGPEMLFKAMGAADDEAVTGLAPTVPPKCIVPQWALSANSINLPPELDEQSIDLSRREATCFFTGNSRCCRLNSCTFAILVDSTQPAAAYERKWRCLDSPPL